MLNFDNRYNPYIDGDPQDDKDKTPTTDDNNFDDDFDDDINDDVDNLLIGYMMQNLVFRGNSFC